MNTAKDMTRIVCRALEEKKAVDIRIIDIAEISTLADYFIIASGTNQNQVQALVDNVEEKLELAGSRPKHIEGHRTGSWILMDYGDIVVHIFDEENRLFYDLERIWRDGKTVELSDL